MLRSSGAAEQRSSTKLSEVKFNTSRFAYISDSLSYNNKFKRFYSIKSNSSGYLLSNDEFNLYKENLDNSNKYFNFEEDLRALHSLYIKDLFKDRIAPVIPFDSNLILASFNLSDIKERSEFLKEWVRSIKGGYIFDRI